MRATWGGLVLLALAFGCGDPPVDDSDGGMRTTCLEHAECDDGMFCNGGERCLPDDPAAAPDGCVPGAPPCATNEICEEALTVCRPDCEVDEDADDDGHVAIACGGDDCDDADPERHPGALEVCDLEGRDEDCDPSTVGDRDIDGDGLVSSQCCNGSTCGPDCDDNVRSTHPGSVEVCDGADNDCDGATDEGLRVELFRDRDHDGVGTAGSREIACPGTPGFSAASGDCDDSRASVRPTAPEICDDLDNDCDEVVDEFTVAVPWYVDRDGDGWGIVNAADPSIESCVPPEGRAIRPGDCDDAEAGRNPEAPERCNGIDDDCNGRADYRIETGDGEDDDRDGVPDARCELETADCDDRDPYSSLPDSVELCDLRDNDCDGTVDEGATEVAWYADVDGDGRGDASDTIMSCEPVPGRVLASDDCDDTDVSSYPSAADACGGQPGIDDDCDGITDEGGSPSAFYVDADGDGFGSTERVFACFLGVGTSRRTGDCDDSNPAVRPDALDDCAGLVATDDDCDGRMDESPAMRTFYADMDGDGFGAGAAMSGCSQPAGTVTNVADCDDTDRLINPLVPDDCGGRLGEDDDCDGRTDEAAMPMTYYADTDGDGYGDPAAPRDACGAPMGFVRDMRDCDDTRAEVSLDATEVCDNGLDDDCDGMADCEDPACRAACPVLVVVSGADQSAAVHERYAAPLVLRVEAIDGSPIEGRNVSIVGDGVLAEMGNLRTTDAAGEVSFALRAGLTEGTRTVVASSPGAVSITLDEQVTAPADGTIFTVVNGPRSGFLTPVPRPAWFAAGTVAYGPITAAPSGAIYVGWNHQIFRIREDAIVEHFAFAGTGGVPPAEGVDARTVQHTTDVRVTRIAYDAMRSRLLFTYFRSIYAVDVATHEVSLVAGSGSDTSDGRDATVTAWPADIREMTVTPNGVIWVKDNNNVMRVIGVDGIVQTAFAANGHGSAPLSLNSAAGGITPVGDGSDDIYLSAVCSVGPAFNVPCVVRARDDGVITLVAGGGMDESDGAPVLDARLRNSHHMVTLPDGDIVMLERDAGINFHRIRRITPGGTVRTVAGTLSSTGDTGDGGPGTSALLDTPHGLTAWRGHVVFPEEGNDVVRAVW